MMSRLTYRLFMAFGVAIVTSAVNAQPGPRHARSAVWQAIEDLQPFTHTALVPVGSDLSSFRFQGVKVVSLPTRRRSTIDQRYCAEIAFRDSDGSMYCPSVQLERFTRAYEVTYVFDGQPLSSDEQGTRRFTFSVYFRPDEWNSAVQAALATRRAGRTDAAALFKLTTARSLEERWAIDGEHSTFCEGNYSDGTWVNRDRQCENTVKFKKIIVPSDYIAVRVDLAASREVAALSAK